MLCDCILEYTTCSFLFPLRCRGSTQNKSDIRKKKRISEADRLFSNSSVTSQKVCTLSVCVETCKSICQLNTCKSPFLSLCAHVFALKAINPRIVNEMESSVQEVPSELSIHGSVPEDMSDSLSQTSSLAGEDRPGTSSLAFGGSSAYKKKRGPLTQLADLCACGKHLHVVSSL